MFNTTDPEPLTCDAVNAAVCAGLHAVRDDGLLSPAVSDQIQAILEDFYARVSLDLDGRDEAYWQSFQALFGFAKVDVDRRVTPMNAANLCPEPTALLQASNLLRLEYNNNVAQQLRTGGKLRALQLEQTRRSLAALLKLPNANNLAVVRNASEGNNAINNGYRDWKKGDNVVLWDGNHPTNNVAWDLRQRHAPTPFEIKRVSLLRTDTPDQIASKFIAVIDDHTRIVSYSLISNSNGIRIPDTAVWKIWKHALGKANCHVHVDGTMGWGAVRVDLTAPPFHSFTSSAHKWFLGPKETAILYMAAKQAPNFVPNIYAYDYKIHIYDLKDIPANALRFELIGQRDDANLITLQWTAAMWQLLQAKQPEQRVTELADHLIGLLDRRDKRWVLVTPADAQQRAGVLWFAAPRGNRKQTLSDFIYEHHRIAAAGNDALFRVCPHIYNTKDDLVRLVKGMNAWYEGP